MPIAAGIIADLFVATVVALRFMAAEAGRTTLPDGVEHAALRGGRHRTIAGQIRVAILADNIRHFEGGRVMAGRPVRDRCRAPQADLGSPVTYWQPYGGKYPSSGDSGALGGVGSGGDPPRLRGDAWQTHGAGDAGGDGRTHGRLPRLTADFIDASRVDRLGRWAPRKEPLRRRYAFQ